jgi:hypothetical protein
MCYNTGQIYLLTTPYQRVLADYRSKRGMPEVLLLLPPGEGWDEGIDKEKCLIF